jgi:hypothetical protein
LRLLLCLIKNAWSSSNSCARTLIFGSFFFIVFFSSFYSLLFVFLALCFIAFSPFFDLVFYRPSFPPFFFAIVLSCFLAHVVSSLSYHNLLGIKMLGCCCYVLSCIKCVTSTFIFPLFIIKINIFFCQSD